MAFYAGKVAFIALWQPPKSQVQTVTAKETQKLRKYGLFKNKHAIEKKTL